jgi:chromosome segregation ATPase
VSGRSAVDPKHFSSIAALLKDKDAKSVRLKSELREITEQFEINWGLIQSTDVKIAKLQAELDSVTSELQESTYRADDYATEVETLNARLTELEDRDAKICSNIHDLTIHINRVEFETERIQKNQPTSIHLPIEDEIAELERQQEDAVQRRAEAKTLADQIHESGTAELANAEAEFEVERGKAVALISKAKENQTEHLSMIQSVESELRECLNHLDAQSADVQPSFVDSSAECAALNSKIRELDKEIMKLEDECNDARKVEQEKQGIIGAIEKRLDEREESNEGAQLAAMLEKDEKELERLRTKLADQTDRNAALKKSIDALSENETPDFDEYKKCQRRRLEDNFTEKVQSQRHRLNQARQSRRLLVPQIRAKAEECDAVLDDLRRLAIEIHRDHDRAKNRKRKIKALAIPTAELEGELAGLKNPGTDQELIQKMSAAREKLRATNERMKAELQRLCQEEAEIGKQAQVYESQNAQLREYLAPYPKFRRYYLAHRPRQRRRQTSDTVAHAGEHPTGARLVLECHKVDIQAS